MATTRLYATAVACLFSSLALAACGGGDTPPGGPGPIQHPDPATIQPPPAQPDAGMTTVSTRPDAATMLDASAPMPHPGTGGIEVSAGVRRALILIDMEEMTVGEVTLPRSFRDLDARMHVVCLKSSSSQRVGCTEAIVKANEMTPAEVPLLPRQDGLWRRLEDNRIERVESRFYPPDHFCPDTWVRIPLGPFGAVCVEKDDTLSLCKNRASACDGDYAKGRILENGNRMDLDSEFHYGAAVGHNTFIRQ